ncbi:MAG: alanine--glyoxylate aminotransferase family protein [Candidatus Diapherotrites archaeon]
MVYKKLFIPGPTHVRDDVLQKLATPAIGHRSKDFSALYDSIQPKIQKLLYTKNVVYMGTHSATGWMEAAIRNCVGTKVLNTINGAFSKRWNGIAGECGKDNEAINVEWGKAIKPEMIKEKLETGEFDAVCVTHNETSTGVMNPLEEIAEVMKEYPDVMFMVDAVSSMSGAKIEVDKLGIDVILASVQKCFAISPGFSICAVSEKAMEKSKDMKDKGYYFDYWAFDKYHKKSQTPTTPSTPHMFALDYQLDRIFEEGAENRFARHKKMANYVRGWVKNNFEMFAELGYESLTVTTATNTKGISVADLNSKLGERGFMISNGYGDLKEKTFRIAHMGDLQIADLKEVIENIEDILEMK